MFPGKHGSTDSPQNRRNFKVCQDFEWVKKEGFVGYSVTGAGEGGGEDTSETTQETESRKEEPEAASDHW